MTRAVLSCYGAGQLFMKSVRKAFYDKDIHKDYMRDLCDSFLVFIRFW